MELVLHPTLPSQIILAPRIAPPSNPAQEENVFVAIVKGTYVARGPGDASSEPGLAAGQLPIFLTDIDMAGAPTPTAPFRYEHDLAAFKPFTDIVVLGDSAPPPTPAGAPGPLGGFWTETVTLGGDSMSQVMPPPGGSSPGITFGWESRSGDTAPNDQRKKYAGDTGSFNPNGSRKLPDGFDNRFFNGGLYQGGGRPKFDHPVVAPGATVITATHATQAQFDVGGGHIQTVSVVHRLLFPAPGPTAVMTYRMHSLPDLRTTSQAVPMNADTIVYDKAAGTFYVVWRGVWVVDQVRPADRYISFVLS